MKLKKIILTLFAVLLPLAQIRADEGMWLLPLLEKMNSKVLAEAGCRLTPEQIYSVNNSSLKDAVVQFGSGCTAEIISDEGLLITNHHCGYSSIQQLSSIEHDYLGEGYWAMKRSDELPCKGLTVTFLQSMTDITAGVEKARAKAVKGCKDMEKAEELAHEAQMKFIKEAEAKALAGNRGCRAEVYPFYNENVFYLIVYKTYRDIRFVGAPPSSIGKFGADTDNWMWPRHTCDFSMFRVYAGKDNEPADYCADNVPYSPKQHLKISLKGVQEGDYTMIMGYPGRTTRFQTSPELQFQIEQNDIRIAARTIRQDIMMEEMLADPKVKIQYASKYSSSSNGWKKWQGMKLAFDKLDIIRRARQEEEDFNVWAGQNKKRSERYSTVTDDIAGLIASSRGPSLAYTTAVESVYRIELASFAMNLKSKCLSLVKNGKDTTAALEEALSSMERQYEDYCEKLDRREAAALLEWYRDNAGTGEYLKGLGEDFESMDIGSYVGRVFDESSFTGIDKLRKAVAADGYSIFKKDAVAPLVNSILTVIYEKYGLMGKTDTELAKARRTYTAGCLEWRKGQPSYPDANFTMRLTYGHVLPYEPKDAVIYKYYTTLDGVMEKEDPDNWEFVVPGRLKELWKNRDFGGYAMEDGRMPACFLTNNDITGGNSGSPVLNADGQLLGLAFDGNWESMSSDVMFEPRLQRCICVDIRYVLFILDKFGGAGYLLDEMDLVR